jgi:hypothetical protein
MDVEAVIGQALAAVERLALVEVDGLTDGQLHRGLLAACDVLPVVEAAVARLAEAWRVRGVWCEDGSRTAHGRLARDLHCRPATTKRMVRRAADLAVMPATGESFAAGRINADHVELLRHADHPARHTLFVRDEQLLVEACSQLPYPDAEHGHDGPPPAWRDRGAGCARGGDGELIVRAILDPVGGGEFLHAWEAIEHELYVADQRSGEESRSVAQRRADALVEMARRALRRPGANPRIGLTVAVGDDSFRRLCELADGTVVDPRALLPHLGRIDVNTIIYDGPFEAIGASRRRTFTGALRRAIEIRDRHCQHPDGDHDPISRCDVDHIVPRSQGGCTCQHNGRLLSRHRNRNPRARQLTSADITVYDDDPAILAVRARLQAVTEHRPP